jgi:hypothetical protein
MVGGVILAYFESKLHKEVSDGMVELGEVAKKLTGMDLEKLVNKDTDKFVINLTETLTRTARGVLRICAGLTQPGEIGASLPGGRHLVLGGRHPRGRRPFGSVQGVLYRSFHIDVDDHLEFDDQHYPAPDHDFKQRWTRP